MNIKKITIGITSIIALFSIFAVTTFAESLPTINFESYTLGSISGQDGWSNAVNPAYDQEVVTNSYGYASFGTKTFRISDAVTSGSFGDWVFVKPLTDSVGETSSTNGTFSTGTKQAHFEMQFDIASTMPEEQQPGLHISVSPDRGDGSRMSYLRFEDGTGGINVFFDDVQGTTNPANFVETQIGTNLNRTTTHAVKLTLDTIDGASNDVVKVWIDGNLVHTGTSWENYYRFDNEASAEQSPRIIKTMIIQARGNATIANDGKGFLFDNINLSSGPIPVTPTPTPDPYAIPAECSGIVGLGAPIIGKNKSEKINGTSGNDLIFGNGGADTIDGKGGDDCIVGGSGADKLIGGNGNDVLLGKGGADTLDGGNNNDKLYGEGAADTLKGGSGDDILDGGAAYDTARGELGTDTCIAESKNSCEL